MTFPYVLGNKSLTVVVDGVPYHLTRPADGGDQGLWDAVKAALGNPDTTAEQIINLLSPAQSVAAATTNIPEVAVVNGELHYNGAPVHNALAAKIIDIINEGLPVEPWVLFAQNVYANPAEYSRDELYLFLEKADLPITEDGHFLAYKNVSADYKDLYTRTFDNSIGAVCEMDRDKVDPVRERTCSFGLHFASKDYLPHYYSTGSRTVVVKINPKDVVSIPSDYDNTKGRTCRYEVVGEIPLEKAKTYSWPAVVNEDEYLEDDDWYEDEDYNDPFWDDDPEDDAEPEDTTPAAPVPSDPVQTPLAPQVAPQPKKKLRWFRRGS